MGPGRASAFSYCFTHVLSCLRRIWVAPVLRPGWSLRVAASAGHHGQGRPSFPAWLVAPWCSVSRNPSSERRGSTRCASRVIIREVVAWRGRCRGVLAIFVFMFHLAFPTEGLAATPRASNQTSNPVYRAVALNATIVSRAPSGERPVASGAEPRVLPITSGEHALGSAVMSPHRRPVLAHRKRLGIK